MKKEWIFFAVQTAAIVLILYAAFAHLSIFLLVGLVFHTAGNIYLMYGSLPKQKSIKHLLFSILPLLGTLVYFIVN